MDSFKTTVLFTFLIMMMFIIVFWAASLLRKIGHTTPRAYHIHRLPQSQIAPDSLAVKTLSMLVELGLVKQQTSTPIPSDFSILQKLGFIKESEEGPFRVFKPTPSGISFAQSLIA